MKMCPEWCGSDECFDKDEPNCQEALGNPPKYRVERDSKGRTYRVYYFDKVI